MPFNQYMQSGKQDEKSYTYMQCDSDNATRRTLTSSCFSCIKYCINLFPRVIYIFDAADLSELHNTFCFLYAKGKP